MTIQQCKQALEISKRGSFSEAAKHLFVAQSSLSNSIKSLESELGIKIFERTNNGVRLTGDGAEFIRYVSRLAQQHQFILERYKPENVSQRLYVSTQHYDFVADIFCKIINETKSDMYRFALRENQTYNVIQEVETGYSDIGILAIKKNDEGIMNRYLNKRGLVFTPVLKALPHAYMRKGHPLSENNAVKIEELKKYPYLSYEQGKHNNSFFSEEIIDEFNDRHIEICDRASLMNVLLTTDCCTIGTGIMPSRLNDGKIISVPLESNMFYSIGYILQEDRKHSELTEKFIKYLTPVKSGNFVCDK